MTKRKVTQEEWDKGLKDIDEWDKNYPDIIKDQGLTAEHIEAQKAAMKESYGKSREIITDETDPKPTGKSGSISISSKLGPSGEADVEINTDAILNVTTGKKK